MSDFPPYLPQELQTDIGVVRRAYKYASLRWNGKYVWVTMTLEPNSPPLSCGIKKIDSSLETEKKAWAAAAEYVRTMIK